MAHPDLDELLNALLPFAQQMLTKRGEFFPFGTGMKLRTIENAGRYAKLALGGTGGKHRDDIFYAIIISFDINLKPNTIRNELG